MKKTLALWVAGGLLLVASPALAIDCGAVIGLLDQGVSPEEIARSGGVPLSAVDACQRRRQMGGFRLNPAGPPPVNAAGPPPRNPAGPPPLNPAGPPPQNPAGIPK
jgi:hypothetical protein